MLKSLNLSDEDVKSFVLGEKNELRTTVERVFVLANEGANMEEKAQFSKEDAKVIRRNIEDMQNRIDILKSMTVANEGVASWMKEVLTEDKSHWIAEFSNRINSAHTTAEIIKVIEDLDKKIDDCRDVLEDNVTIRSVIRVLIAAGVISVGAAVAGAIGGAVGIAAAVASSANINKSKTMIRQVQNELLTLRKKALNKRDQLRKTEYHDYREDGNDSIDEATEDDDFSYGDESPNAVYEELMKR